MSSDNQKTNKSDFDKRRFLNYLDKLMMQAE